MNQNTDNHTDNLRGRSAADALEPMIDYGAQRLTGSEQILSEPRGLIGSLALIITSREKATNLQDRFDAWRERRRTKKITPAPTPAAPTPAPAVLSRSSTVYRTIAPHHLPPQPVANEPGVYRSHASGNQPITEVTPSPQESPEIMDRAIERARALGELPVAQMYQPKPPATEDDGQLLARLEEAFKGPAYTPPHEKAPYKPRHAAEHDDKDGDDQLISTSA